MPDRPAPALIASCPPPGARIGEVPPLWPTSKDCAGQRLFVFCRQAMAPEEFELADYGSVFWRVYASERPLGTLTPKSVGRSRIAEITRRLAEETASGAVFMGPAVAAVFDLRGPLLHWDSAGDFAFSVFPSLSRRNPFWRNEINRQRARDFLRALILRQQGRHDALDLRT